ncbi:MAG TPA: methionyl-tRNA formyltransferase [Gemmatimonadales bacterium]|nr:methionyl-tRNA formyltransferase [Gemmatimonadales bacterium]
MRIAFFGTPAFAVPSLRALLEEGFDVTAVITQPDRARGRSRSQVIPSEIKAVAEAEGLPVLQPERPMGDLFAKSLAHSGADIGVVVAYGHILRPEILSAPKYGMINVHASLLPKLRGPAPVHWAILNGDETTGVSIMRLEAGLDTGPVLHRIETEIAADETGGELTERLAELGAEALVEALTLLAADAVREEPQDHSLATYAPKINRELCRLEWGRDAAHLARMIRAFDPEPGAWATFGGQEVKLFGAKVASGSGEPGAILECGRNLVVAAAIGAMEIQEIQPAGKKRMSAAAWARGHSSVAGQHFS